MALITLDNGHDHTKPNTFGPKGLASLNTAIDAALAARRDRRDRRHRQAVHPGRRRRPDRRTEADRPRAGAGHRPDRPRGARKLVDGGMPTFAFVNGVALGGGLEVALHATTAPSRRRPACSRRPRSSSAWSPAGAATSCCRT